MTICKLSLFHSFIIFFFQLSSRKNKLPVFDTARCHFPSGDSLDEPQLDVLVIGWEKLDCCSWCLLVKEFDGCNLRWDLFPIENIIPGFVRLNFIQVLVAEVAWFFYVFVLEQDDSATYITDCKNLARFVKGRCCQNVICFDLVNIWLTKSTNVHPLMAFTLILLLLIMRRWILSEVFQEGGIKHFRAKGTYAANPSVNFLGFLLVDLLTFINWVRCLF